jgi:hypothetical protein
MSAPLCHPVGMPNPACPSCGYGTERRALDRSQRAYAATAALADGTSLHGAFTGNRPAEWVVTGSLSEARMIAYLHNLAYGFGE